MLFVVQDGKASWLGIAWNSGGQGFEHNADEPEPSPATSTRTMLTNGSILEAVKLAYIVAILLT